MFVLRLLFADNAPEVQLVFNSSVEARRVRDDLLGGGRHEAVTDQYGHELILNGSPVAFLVIDCERDLSGNMQLARLQQDAQARAQKLMATNDARSIQPAILAPGVVPGARRS